VGTALRERPRTQKTTEDHLLGLAFGIAERGGSLISGSRVTCPGCENVADILDYHHLEVSSKYLDQVVPPLKCRVCRHVFAMVP